MVDGDAKGVTPGARDWGFVELSSAHIVKGRYLPQCDYYPADVNEHRKAGRDAG